MEIKEEKIPKRTISPLLIFDNSISDRARFVYCYMSYMEDLSNVDMKHLAIEMGYSVDTLRKYIDELYKKGWITRKSQNNNGRFGHVNFELLPEAFEKILNR